MRMGFYVGAGFGVLAAIGVVLFQGTAVSLLLETLLAIAAGAVTANLLSRAPAMLVPAGAAPGGTPVAPARPGSSRVRSGVAAGAVVGVLAGIAFTVIAFNVVNGAGFRDQLNSVLAQQNTGSQISIDSLLGVVTGCIGCFYILIIPAITAGCGALGAWIYGLVRPAPAAAPPVPPPQPPMPPAPPLPPGGTPGSAGQ